MLSLFIIWFYIAFLSFTYGLLWLEIIAATGYVKTKTLVPIEIILVAGSGVLSVILGVLHLWLPVAGVIHGILLTGSILIIWKWNACILPFLKSYKVASGYTLPYAILFLIFSVLVLILAAQPIINPGTGLYHAQTIQWFEKYRIVPGLGNLSGPLALNSHAHLLMSLFSFSFLELKVFHAAWGSFVFLLYSAYALREGFNAAHTRPIFAIYFFGTLFWGFVFFSTWVSSPTPDPAIMFFFFILFGVLLTTNKNEDKSWQTAFVFFLLPILVSFKLSALFGGIIGIAWLLILNNQVNASLFKLIIIQAFIILAPFFLRNVILSGHLIYPLPGQYVFNLDWTVPQSWLISYKEDITTFARAPIDQWRNYIDEPIRVWFREWWVNQNRVDKVFLGIFTLLLPLFLGQVINNFRHRTDQLISVLWLSAFIASLTWFYSVPAIRFGYGYLVPVLLLGIILSIRIPIPAPYVLGMGLFLALFGIGSIARQVSRTTFSLFWPAPYQKAVIEVTQIGKVKTRVALGDGRCWNEPIPCTLPDPHPGLEMRGKNIEDGFRTVHE